MALHLVRVLCLAALLAICTGCPRNSDNTVTVVLQGNPTLTSQVAEHLAASLLDDANWSHVSYSQWGWADTKITLAPVVDPESLRHRIHFGNVTQIEGRTVYVQVDRIRGTVLVLSSRVWKVIRETFGSSDELLP